MLFVNHLGVWKQIDCAKHGGPHCGVHNAGDREAVVIVVVGAVSKDWSGDGRSCWLRTSEYLCKGPRKSGDQGMHGLYKNEVWSDRWARHALKPVNKLLHVDGMCEGLC